MQVVATAGHVDHGKSSLIVRLTGIDPDRWAEEKRRGLTIDLGFAWTTLPSGNEIGFVDVPGHERFVRNMLAGVGPARLVLFVVAADEGWKPQSEEHLAIVDVLGAAGGVVALTKADLIEPADAERRTEDLRARLAGTVLADAEIVPCSARTGDGLEELVGALDRMVAAAPIPEEDGRPRMHVDRAFSITGAGTVVTGTLTGGPLRVGDHVVLLPGGTAGRIRQLQTHRRSLETARPVSRVAANLSGVDRSAAARGDVLTRPGRWLTTTEVDVLLRPVRSVDHAITARGAYKVYLGSAERDARLRPHGGTSIDPGSEGLARLRLAAPVVAAVGDRFVLREAGRRRTVGGGRVLDPHPPRSDPDPTERLRRRRNAGPAELPEILVAERGAIRARELEALAGVEVDRVPGASLLDGWWIGDPLRDAAAAAALDLLASFHREHPLRPGPEAAAIREAVSARVGAGEEVVAAVLAWLEHRGGIARAGTSIRLPAHRVSLGDREGEAERLIAEIAGAEPTPPTRPELERGGHGVELLDACVETGRLARISRDLYVTPAFLARAEGAARRLATGPGGLRVSEFREELGTTRKYALPILESFDGRGITRRDGEVRRLRD